MTYTGNDDEAPGHADHEHFPLVGHNTSAFVDRACPSMPPSPPGWDEWWQRHRAEVAAAIKEAQEAAVRGLEFRFLQACEEHGLLGLRQIEGDVAVPAAFLKRVRDIFRTEGPKALR